MMLDKAHGTPGTPGSHHCTRICSLALVQLQIVLGSCPLRLPWFLESADASQTGMEGSPMLVDPGVQGEATATTGYTLACHVLRPSLEDPARTHQKPSRLAMWLWVQMSAHYTNGQRLRAWEHRPKLWELLHRKHAVAGLFGSRGQTDLVGLRCPRPRAHTLGNGAP